MPPALCLPLRGSAFVHAIRESHLPPGYRSPTQPALGRGVTELVPDHPDLEGPACPAPPRRRLERKCHMTHTLVRLAEEAPPPAWILTSRLCEEPRALSKHFPYTCKDGSQFPRPCFQHRGPTHIHLTPVTSPGSQAPPRSLFMLRFQTLRGNSSTESLQGKPDL